MTKTTFGIARISEFMKIHGQGIYGFALKIEFSINRHDSVAQ